MDVLEQIEMYLRPHNPGFINPHKHVDRVEPLLRAASEEIKILRDALQPHANVKGSKSLVLYFDNDVDRQGFVEAFKEVKPNDLVNWAYANPEAARALIDGKAAVLPLDIFGKVDSEGNLSSYYGTWINFPRLDHPSNNTGDGK